MLNSKKVSQRAFAAKVKTDGDTSSETETNATATAATDTAKVKPVLTAVSTTVAMPERKNNRGGQTSYPFDELAVVGASFGVKNKTAKAMGSVVSMKNRKSVVDKVDEAGNVVMKDSGKFNEIKDQNGVVVSKTAVRVPETVAVKKFFVLDVDAATDPDGAMCRVWREL